MRSAREEGDLGLVEQTLSGGSQVAALTATEPDFVSRASVPRIGAPNFFSTHSSRTFVFESHVHHSNLVPSNGAFTTRFTSLSACCTHVFAHLTKSY